MLPCQILHPHRLPAGSVPPKTPSLSSKIFATTPHPSSTLLWGEKPRLEEITQLPAPRFGELELGPTVPAPRGSLRHPSSPRGQHGRRPPHPHGSATYVACHTKKKTKPLALKRDSPPSATVTHGRLSLLSPDCPRRRGAGTSAASPAGTNGVSPAPRASPGRRGGR